jgi:hypothetical protein
MQKKNDDRQPFSEMLLVSKDIYNRLLKCLDNKFDKLKLQKLNETTLPAPVQQPVKNPYFEDLVNLEKVQDKQNIAPTPPPPPPPQNLENDIAKDITQSRNEKQHSDIDESKLMQNKRGDVTRQTEYSNEETPSLPTDDEFDNADQIDNTDEAPSLPDDKEEGVYKTNSQQNTEMQLSDVDNNDYVEQADNAISTRKVKLRPPIKERFVFREKRVKVCRFCNKSLSSNYTLNRHIKTLHENNSVNKAINTNGGAKKSADNNTYVEKDTTTMKNLQGGIKRKRTVDDDEDEDDDNEDVPSAKRLKPKVQNPGKTMQPSVRKRIKRKRISIDDEDDENDDNYKPSRKILKLQPSTQKRLIRTKRKRNPDDDDEDNVNGEDYEPSTKILQKANKDKDSTVKVINFQKGKKRKAHEDDDDEDIQPKRFKKWLP